MAVGGTGVNSIARDEFGVSVKNIGVLSDVLFAFPEPLVRPL